MTKVKLGLPLDYKELSEHFDALNIHKDTEAQNLSLEKLLKSHNVKTVLDLTCGTGSQVFFLADRGYQVMGADLSSALLKQAREKARRKDLDIPFIEGDMRTVKIGTFDAVITIFNAVGHLTKKGVEKAIKNIHQNLKRGGIYVFDILSLEAIEDDASVADLACYSCSKVGNTHLLAIQCSTIDRQHGILTSYDSFLIQKNNLKPKRVKHSFSLQLYTAKELRELLSKNGFETIKQYGIDGTEFLEKTTKNILTVARKQ